MTTTLTLESVEGLPDRRFSGSPPRIRTRPMLQKTRFLWKDNAQL